MAAPKGHARYGGRTKGTLNKRTTEFRDVLEQRGFCAATALMDIHDCAKKIYDAYGTIFDAINEKREIAGLFSLQDNAHQYLKIAFQAASEIASYSTPKLKAIEHKNVSPLDGMTPEQKLEAMKEAVRFIEAQIKPNG